MACHFIRDYYSDLRKFQAMSIYITPVWQCFAAVIILTNPSWHNVCAYESCNPTTDRVLALLFSGHFFLLFFAWIRVRAIGSICCRRDADEQVMHACSLSANDKDQGLFHTWHGRYCFESRSIPGCEWNRRWVKPVCFNPPICTICSFHSLIPSTWLWQFLLLYHAKTQLQSVIKLLSVTSHCWHQPYYSSL